MLIESFARFKGMILSININDRPNQERKNSHSIGDQRFRAKAKEALREQRDIKHLAITAASA
jgi:hypothetical protein